MSRKIACSCRALALAFYEFVYPRLELLLDQISEGKVAEREFIGMRIVNKHICDTWENDGPEMESIAELQQRFSEKVSQYTDIFMEASMVPNEKFQTRFNQLKEAHQSNRTR